MRPETQENVIRMVIVISLILHLSGIVFADLITTPKDTETLIGAQTFFNCSTTLRSTEIQWFHYDVGNDQERHLVYGFDQFHGTFHQRCRIERNEAVGEYNLVIESVSIEDAGKFECQDDMGRGVKASAQLSALETVPVCESNMKDQGIIGPNSGGIEPEELHLTCTVDYRGNQPPQMIWKRSDSNDTITEGVTHTIVNDTRVTYSLIVKANRDIDGQTFGCETTKSRAVQHGCNSSQIKVVGSNTVVIILIIVSCFLGLFVMLTIVCATLWMNSSIQRRKESGSEIPAAAEGVKSSEQYELIPPNEQHELAVVKEELDRVKEECERLRLKVSQYENRIYAGAIDYKDKPKLIHSIPVGKEKAAIKGITVLIYELFAIFENRPDILVYDSVTFTLKRNPITIDGSWNPQDIASCSRNKCLYVIDQSSEDTQKSHLMTIDPERRKSITSWNHIDCQGGRLSVYDANIILCFPEKRIIVKYSPSGAILLTIRLSPADGFDHLHYAIQVTETNFVLSSYNRGHQKQNLCLVDCDGKIITSMKDENKQLSSPTCLIIDNDMSVLVLYHGNNKTLSLKQTKSLVSLLNHQLQNTRTLIERCSDEYGVKMCLDSTGSRLFVAVNSLDLQNALWHSGRIVIYNLQ